MVTDIEKQEIKEITQAIANRIVEVVNETTEKETTNTEEE